MEFGEKLQNLRKSKDLTQEELAQCLYVSRAAISKWESGRGYPSIDSIKEIASFFSVTVDELLSGEKILSLAKKENKLNLQRICDLTFGIVDLLAVLLIVLPLYPNAIGGHIYSVSLFSFIGAAFFSIIAYWVLFIALILLGIIKIISTTLSLQKEQKAVSLISIGISIIAVTLLILTRQVYATIVIFALLLIKGFLYLKHSKI